LIFIKSLSKNQLCLPIHLLFSPFLTPKNGGFPEWEVVEKWGYVIDMIEDAWGRPLSLPLSNPFYTIQVLPFWKWALLHNLKSGK
jgi:hypothetical protein